MRLSVLGLVFLLFHLGALGHTFGHAPIGVGQLYRRHQRGHELETHVHGHTDKVLNGLQRRQAPSSSSSVPMPSTSTSANRNLTTEPKDWDAQTTIACEKAVRALNGHVLSQLGVAICHNIFSFDNSTGAFQGDLRVYRVSPPQGAWTGVADQDIGIKIQYAGAQVKNGASGNDGRSSASAQKRDNGKLQLLQQYSYNGQLVADYLTTPMNLTQLVTLLAPNVTLSDIHGDKGMLSTTLTSKEASFVNGVFAGSPVGAASANSARPSPFVLPGTSLGIFPVGLIITSVWACLGVGVMAWGTFGRYQYRQQYRRRKMRERLVAPRT